MARTVKSDSGAIKTLVRIFQEDLKAYLPCYYDVATGIPKSLAELEAFHLNQRWEIGRKSLSILHPIEQEVSVEVLSDTSSHTSEKTAIAPPPLENNTLLNTAVLKIDPLVEQNIKDQPSVLVVPGEAPNNRQLIELSIQNNAPHKALALNTGVKYNDAASRVMKMELLQKIQAMQKYGVLLKDQNISKGQIIIDLANDLTIVTNQFFDQEPEQRNFAEFEPRFSKLLHSKDQEMSAYRIAWGTIIANIAIALTGIGLLFIAGKLIHSKVTENRALFFFQKSKTTSEEKIADVEHAANLITQSA